MLQQGRKEAANIQFEKDFHFIFECTQHKEKKVFLKL